MARISATFCSHHCQRAINFYFRATRTCATFFSAVALKVAQVPSTVDLVQSRERGVVGSINMQSRVSFALSSERGEILVSYSLVKISWLGLKRTSEPSCQASWVAASSQAIEFSLAPSRLKVSHTPRQAGVWGSIASEPKCQVEFNRCHWIKKLRPVVPPLLKYNNSCFLLFVWKVHQSILLAPGVQIRWNFCDIFILKFGRYFTEDSLFPLNSDPLEFFEYLQPFLKYKF